jgi:anti-sigma-K factor RskA
MEYTEDHIALAAEYALGTLDADERAQVETLIATDTEFAAMVQAWEFRLGVLNQMVGSVEPRPELWERIRSAVGISAVSQAPVVLPETPPPVAPMVLQDPASQDLALQDSALQDSALQDSALQDSALQDSALQDSVVQGSVLQDLEPGATPQTPPAAPPPAAGTSNVIELTGRLRAYRNIAAAMTAIAAVLLALIGVQIVSPGSLPGLGGKPPTQVAEVKPRPSPTPSPALAPSAQYVALLQGAAGGPAFILTVDGATRNFTVRKVGAPPIDPNKSYELWLISDKLQNRPRSLGVIGASEFTSRPVLAGYDADVVNSGTYAVTVEQSGGSPDGAPHSQPVFIGRLIETVPASPAPSPRQKQ